MKPAFAAALAALAVGGLVFAAVAAGRPEPGATPTPQEVYERTMSPFCPGITLAECTTRQSAALKQEISAKISRSWTNTRIDSWLVLTYGRDVLGRPRGLAIWLAPLIAGGLAAGAAATFATRAGRSNTGAIARPRALKEDRASNEELARIQQELDQFGMSTE